MSSPVVGFRQSERPNGSTLEGVRYRRFNCVPRACSGTHPRQHPSENADTIQGDYRTLPHICERLLTAVDERTVLYKEKRGWEIVSSWPLVSEASEVLAMGSPRFRCDVRVPYSPVMERPPSHRSRLGFYFGAHGSPIVLLGF